MNDQKLAELEKKALEAALEYVKLAYQAAPTKTQGYLTKIEVDDKAAAAAETARTTWIAANKELMDHLMVR